jgi:uncharacterized membrane protein
MKNERLPILIQIRPIQIIIGIAIVYTLFLSTLSVLQHYGLRTQMNDLGNVDQALWAASNGDLAMTQSNDTDGKLRSRIGVHANLILWLLAVIYLVLPYPEMLLILTSVACALAGVGIYAIARQRLGDTWWAVVPAVAFWISPIVHDANLYDFHIITVVTALLVWTLWAFDNDRPRIAWILLIMALSCNEDVALATLMLGIYLFLSGARRTGLIVAGVSLFYFLILLAVIIPFFNNGHGLSKLVGPGNRYAWLGSNPYEVFQAIIVHPVNVLKHISRPDRLRIVIFLLLCGGIAGFGAWRVLLITLPPIAAGLLSNPHWMTRITGTYYWVICEAIIVTACIFTAEGRIKHVPRRFPWQLVYLSGATLVLSILLSPLPYSFASSWQNYVLPPERHSLEEITRTIPADAAVCVQNNLGPHLSQRRDIAVFPKRYNSADYALFHLRYVGGPDAGLFIRTSPDLYTMSLGHLTSVIKRMVLSQEWELVTQKEGFYLFAHHAPNSKNHEYALKQVDADSELLERSYREASRHRWSWSRYLVSSFTWGQLL